MPKRLVWGLVGLLLVALPMLAAAQRGGRGFGGFGGLLGGGAGIRNAEYDGRFVLARVRYTSGSRWSADYPVMERNLTEMLKEITALPVNINETNVYTLDDPDLLKYPVIYLTEPGYWRPTAAEANGLKAFIDKGGFVIIDDFHYPPEWAVFESSLRMLWPDAILVPLDVTHPIFNTFFQIASLDVPDVGGYGESGLRGKFYGIYENNDPTKRLAAVINYQMDLGDYVEWAQSSRAYQFQPTNEAYKFMINYVIYGLTR